MAQIAADRSNGNRRTIVTEGNMDEEYDRHSRSTGISADSPIKKLHYDSTSSSRSVRSISALNQQRSSPMTYRDDIIGTVGSIHSPNFAQNIENINSRFDSFRTTNCEEQGSVKGLHSSSLNLRMSQDSRGMQTNGNQHMSNSRGVTTQQQQNNKKKVFDASAAATAPIRLTAQSLMGLTKSKIQPLLSASRLHMHSHSNSQANKENINRGNHSNNEDQQYSSITSLSVKETDLEKANERIRYLDSNLRREMLNSEEQRSAMAVLKQELERKLHEFGFMNFFKTNNSSSNLSHIDIYMELQVIKKKLLEKEEKIVQLTREKDPLIRESQEYQKRNRQLEDENEQIRLELNGSQADQEEINDLRAEKINLIEFVEKIKSENERLEEEYVVLKNELHQAKKSQQHISSVEERRRTTIEEDLREQIEYLSEEVAAKNSDLESLAEAVKQETASKESIESQFKSLQMSSEDLQEQLTSMRLKNATLESEVEETQHILSELKAEKASLIENVERIELENESLRGEFKGLKDNTEQLKLQNEGLTETLKMQSEQILGWKQSSQTSTFLQTQFESYQQKFEDAKDNIFTLTQTLEETNAELQKVIVKCQNFELIAKEKAHIILEQEGQITVLQDRIKVIERESDELKRRIHEESKEKYASQFNSEKRSINLQLDHVKSQNALLERKLQDAEMMNERLRFELEDRNFGNSDDNMLNENVKLKYEQNIAFYEKKIKELKMQSMGRRQEQISLSVQIGLAVDIVKQLSQYIRGCDDIELAQIVEDLEFQIEEVTGLISSSTHQTSTHNSVGNQIGATHRSISVNGHSSNGVSQHQPQQPYQYSSRNNLQQQSLNFQVNQQHMTPSNATSSAYTPQHSQMPPRSKEIEDLKNILSIKDREIQALKSESVDHNAYGMSQQQSSIQQSSRYERGLARQSEQGQYSMHHGQAGNSAGGNGGVYYSGKSNLKSYFN